MWEGLGIGIAIQAPESMSRAMSIACHSTKRCCETLRGQATVKVHPVDLIVFATGFDLVDGSYFGVDFKGPHGKRLEDHWAAEGPRTHHGATMSAFPNLFFVNGPGVPFANNPPSIEGGAEFVTGLIASAEEIRKSES